MLLGTSLLLFLFVGLFFGRTIGAVTRYAGVLSRLSAWGKAVAFLLIMGLVFVGSQAAIQALLPDDADILHDESFGPILPIVPVQSEEEALERTNDSNFGLTSSIWTEDRDHARELARDVEAGSVYINDHVTPQGGPEVPWGGIKESGVGRTRGEEGLREMTEPKHIADERLNLDRDFFWYPYSDTFTTWLNRAMPWPFKWWLGG